MASNTLRKNIAEDSVCFRYVPFLSLCTTYDINHIKAQRKSTCVLLASSHEKSTFWITYVLCAWLIRLKRVENYWHYLSISSLPV
jgi:hypothetical protein